MIGKLDNVIHKINTETRFMVSVFDLDKGVYLYKHFEAPRLLKEFGSAENFFEDLNAKGHTHLNIGSYLKNGSGKVKDAQPITVNFEESTQEAQVPTKELTVTPESNPMYTLPITPPLASSPDIASLFGLGAPQVFDLMIKKNDAERLTLEVSELKSENRFLKQENEKYKEELLKDKYDYQKEKDKKGDTHALIGQITTSLPAIMEYIKPANIGLNASDTMDYGSELKNNFVASLNQIDDATLKILIDVANTCVTSEAFTKEFTTLLKKYKICQ